LHSVLTRKNPRLFIYIQNRKQDKTAGRPTAGQNYGRTEQWPDKTRTLLPTYGRKRLLAYGCKGDLKNHYLMLCHSQALGKGINRKRRRLVFYVFFLDNPPFLKICIIPSKKNLCSNLLDMEEVVKQTSVEIQPL
jgi:hypothetical protein